MCDLGPGPGPELDNFSVLLLTRAGRDLATKTANTRHSRGQTFRIWSEPRKLRMFAQTGPCWEPGETGEVLKRVPSGFERLSSFYVDDVGVTKKRVI